MTSTKDGTISLMESMHQYDPASSWRFRIADRFTVRVSSDDAKQGRGFRAFYGVMQCSPDNNTSIDIDCRITKKTLSNARHSMIQAYKFGRWRMQVDRLELPCRVHLCADRLGSLMAAQAGFGGLLRYLLGREGFVWLHAAALERSGKAVVLAGPSGVGKSLIVLRAVRDGWRYITDDHALISDEGLSGITTPILLRGYGAWPDGLSEPIEVRKKRKQYVMLRRLSGGLINMMAGYTPPADRVYGSPAPVQLQTTLCMLRRDGAAPLPSSSSLPADLLLAQAREAGRFMTAWLARELGDACDRFWLSQAQVIRTWASQCETVHAAVAPRLDEAIYRQLAPKIGLEGSRDG